MSRRSLAALALLAAAALAAPTASLAIEPTPGAPANDAFADAAVIEGTSGSMTVDNTGATVETGEPAFHSDWWGETDDFEGRSLWYSWTAPLGVGRTFFRTTGFEMQDHQVGVYTGSLGALVEIAYNAVDYSYPDHVLARVDFVPTAGTTYRIALGGTDEETFTFEWGPSSPPANDDVANAITLVPDAETGLASASVNTEAATWQAGERMAYCLTWEDLCADLGGRSVWYRFTAAGDGPVTISTCDSDVDTVLAVYTGTLGTLMEIAYNDDSPDCGATSLVTFSATASTSYLIGVGGDGDFQMDGGQVISWGDSGNVGLVLHAGPVSAPSAPVVEATAGDGQVSLTWGAPPDGGTPLVDYLVGWSPSPYESWTYDLTSTGGMVVGGLTNGLTWKFTVQARSWYGFGPESSPVTAVPRGAPLAPSIFMAAADDGQVQLGWSEPGDGGSPITGYTVRYRPEGTTTWSYASPTTDTSLAIYGLTTAVMYEFQVRADNDLGQGAYSESAMARPKPTLFQGVTTRVKGATVIVTYWTLPAGWVYTCAIDGSPGVSFSACASGGSFSGIQQGTRTLTMKATYGTYSETKTFTFTIKSGKVK